MTIEQLQKELNSNNAEIESIKKQISAQVSKSNPVDSMYARLNYLTDRNKEIKCFLDESSSSNNGGSDVQMEKGIAISSGGGGVSIRPPQEKPKDSEPQIAGTPGNIIVATSTKLQNQSTIK
jgi:hypothetical protein